MMKSEKFVISDFILDEVFTLILARTNNCTITLKSIEIIDDFIVSGLFIFHQSNEEDIEKTKNIFKKYCDQKLSFTDSHLLYLLKKLSATELITYDEKLSHLSRRNINQKELN